MRAVRALAMARPAFGRLVRLPGDGLRRRVGVGIEDNDLCPLPRIALRDRPADAGPATGDHRNASLEQHRHFSLLFDASVIPVWPWPAGIWLWFLRSPARTRQIFEPGAPLARLTVNTPGGWAMSERRIAQLFGLVLGGVFTFGMVLNALAY